MALWMNSENAIVKASPKTPKLCGSVAVATGTGAVVRRECVAEHHVAPLLNALTDRHFVFRAAPNSQAVHNVCSERPNPPRGPTLLQMTVHHLPTKTIPPVDWDEMLARLLRDHPNTGFPGQSPSPSSDDTTPPPPAPSSVALRLVKG